MKIENPSECLPYAIFLTSLFSETSGFEKTGCSEQQAVFFPEAGKRALCFFVAMWIISHVGERQKYRILSRKQSGQADIIEICLLSLMVYFYIERYAKLIRSYIACGQC